MDFVVRENHDEKYLNEAALSFSTGRVPFEDSRIFQDMSKDFSYLVVENLFNVSGVLRDVLFATAE